MNFHGYRILEQKSIYDEHDHTNFSMKQGKMNEREKWRVGREQGRRWMSKHGNT